MTTRLRFVPMLLAATAALAGGRASAADRPAAGRPNVLWITSEDNSPYLGCYGDRQAQTPNLDKLAAQGVRYRHAFANGPVCSTARTTLIAGMHATSLGVQHHRSRVAIPAGFRLFPAYLRDAGYYCTNNAKTDYNVANPGKPWDDSSGKAHYRNRRSGQPFFAVFNLGSSHESQVAPKPGKTAFRVPPEQVVLPPFHPDEPAIRRDWANYYDQMTIMDAQAGALLDELEQAGLADDTVVFYFGDHGGALPRGKRNVHDSGTRVPLIVRVPPKWAHLAPAAAGAWADEMVSFVDLPPTLFSLTGVPIPAHFQGRAFLGERRAEPRGHVFLYRGRMDERYDTVRAVRTRGFRYVRNYSPHRPWGQHYSYPFQVLPSMRAWHEAFLAGRCDPVQAAYWQPKPAEELYAVGPGRVDGGSAGSGAAAGTDAVGGDPFEIKNLATDPQHAARLADMRRTLRAELIATRDTGFIPEGMFERLAADKTIYAYAQSDAYPIERVVDVADAATSRDRAALPGLLRALADPHPVIRYWGAVGCLVLQDKATSAKPELLAALRDDWADVRVAAAEALGYTGGADAAIDALAGVLGGGEADPYERLAALNALDFMTQAGHVPPERSRSLVKDLKLAEPADRVQRHLLGVGP